MLPSSLVAILASFIIYRLLALSLPAFKLSVAAAPFANLACGSFSDLSVAALLAVVWVVAGRTAARAKLGGGRYGTVVAKAVSVGFGLVAVLLVVTLGVHMRYVQHFGMNLRPFHGGMLDLGEVWWVGAKMVLGSWRSDVIMALPWVVAIAANNRAKTWWRALILGPRLRLVKVIVVLLAVAGVANGAVINLRHVEGLNAELRYQPFAALYYNLKEESLTKRLPMPDLAARARVRKMLPGTRHFAPSPVGDEYPLWQTAVSDRPEATGPRADAGRKLIEFLRKRAAAKGPWNVVVVLSESLRAQEIEVFGKTDPIVHGLTPELTRIASEGIIFTETISGGLRTHYGQMLAMCSLYGADDFGLLNQAPMNNATCVSDVFAERGYDTYFFHGADNRFDNQADFYTKHQMAHIFGERHFPKETAKGGWGFSDHALFDFTLAHLSAARKPFFGVALTLTNHIPHRLPEDAPKDLLQGKHSLRYQILRYVDWSVGDFQRQLAKRFPHTIFVFLADHGLFWEEPPTMAKPSYELLRQVARIPFIITVPGLPEELRGLRLDGLTSNVDMAPTLMKLLGWEGQEQQFMGQDAFSREGPVYIDWQQTLLRIEPTPGQDCCDIHVMPDAFEGILGGIMRYNLLAPPR